MAEDPKEPRLVDDDDDLSLEELEQAAGGIDDNDPSLDPAPNTNACLGGNCNCG